MAQKFKYTEDTMQRALDAVAAGMSVNKASIRFDVPRTTLLYKHSGKTPIQRKMGPQPILSENEEDMLEQWIVFLGRNGFPVTKTQLIESVQMLIKKLERPTPFTDGRPGRHWYESFLKRHPKIAKRVSQNLTPTRASVKEKSIRNWFSEVKIYLQEEGLDSALEDPKRVFNCDETAFFLSPKENYVLVQKGAKLVYNLIASGEKENITTLIIANAAGSLPPPMVVFKFQRIPKNLAASVPKQWGIGRSENGWMTGETFFEYIANIFYPWVVQEGINLPILLFVDGHSSHLTMSLSEFCREHKIVLINLFPNATHLLQPLDVAVFHPLKSDWKKAVHNWRIEHCHQILKKENFCPLLEIVMKTISQSMLANGFRKCGLHPWNPDNIDFSKTIRDPEPAVAVLDIPQDSTEIYVKQHLRFLEKQLPGDKLKKFENNLFENWKGNAEDVSLFYLWRKLKIRANEFSINNAATEENIIFEFDDDMFEMRNGNLYATQQLSTTEFLVEEKDDTASVTGSDNKNSKDDDEEINKDNNEMEVACCDASPNTLLLTTVLPLPSTKESEGHTITHVECRTPSPDNHETITYPSTSGATSATAPEAGKSPTAMDCFLPSPFKSTLFWPDRPAANTPVQKRLREKNPSVATSEIWLTYHRKKEAAKVKKVEEIAERKKIRLENTKSKRKGLSGNSCNTQSTTESWYCNLCELEEQIDMIKCTKCNNWQHEKCANVKSNMKKYICVHCI